MNSEAEKIFKKYLKNFRLAFNYDDGKDLQYRADDIPGMIVCRSLKNRIFIINDLVYNKEYNQIISRKQFMNEFEKFSSIDYTGIENYLRKLIKEIKELNAMHKLEKIKEDFE